MGLTPKQSPRYQDENQRDFRRLLASTDPMKPNRPGPSQRGYLAGRGLVAATLLLGSACYHYRVSAPNVSAATDPEPPSTTQWAFLWGFIEEPIDTSCTCMNNAIKQTTHSTNFAYALLTVVSLGTLVPTEVEVVCSNPPPGSPPPHPPVGCPNAVDLPPGTVPDDEPGPSTPEPVENDPDAGSF